MTKSDTTKPRHDCFNIDSVEEGVGTLIEKDGVTYKNNPIYILHEKKYFKNASRMKAIANRLENELLKDEPNVLTIDKLKRSLRHSRTIQLHKTFLRLRLNMVL